jgi:DNA-binding response OmpR family regulator
MAATNGAAGNGNGNGDPLVRVLVIEDEPRIRQVLARGLARSGIEVEQAADGRSGLERALKGNVDLVVLDLLLPELDGLTVLRVLHERRSELPIVVLSAHSDLRTKLHGFELGASDYVAKPFSIEELVARVRAQVHRRRLGAQDVGPFIKAGCLTLDVAQHQAQIADTVTDLTRREFQLLMHLIKHRGETVSRESLLAEAWGYSFNPGSNIVEVCVRRLRKKLGPRAPIETVRHEGYRVPAT